MSKSDLLYARGMNLSDTEVLNDEEMWDDTQLTNAYDKALRMANIEVAKRIAMSTNNKQPVKEVNQKDDSPKYSDRLLSQWQPVEPNNYQITDSKSKSKGKSSKIKWAKGMPCRAVYEMDGLEYEAIVLQVMNDKECVVTFLGYGNSEIVALNTMKASHGKEAQQRQIEQALLEKGDDSDASGINMNISSDRVNSPGSTVVLSERSVHKREKKKKKKDMHTVVNSFLLPDVMSMPMPSFAKLAQMSHTEMPMPPPPMPFFSSDRADCEEQAISSMLISWYMSGYHAGLYQGMKRAKEHKRRKD